VRAIVQVYGLAPASFYNRKLFAWIDERPISL
jgi:hypothetical protein